MIFLTIKLEMKLIFHFLEDKIVPYNKALKND